MYYEEKIIDGVVHYRTSPGAKFTPYNLRDLSTRYRIIKERLKTATEQKDKVMGLIWRFLQDIDNV